jgi:hypothetical protein
MSKVKANRVGRRLACMVGRASRLKMAGVVRSPATPYHACVALQWGHATVVETGARNTYPQSQV